jgi:protein-S-isoprenylcysteine O-methyltransferase Ste14
MRTRIPGLLARWVLVTASIAALLFLSAGTVRIASIRNYLVAFSLLLLVTMLAVDPSLAQERAKPTEPGTDDSRITAGLLFLLTLTVAGYSVGHLSSGFILHAYIRNAALGVFMLSSALQAWAMIVNPFFSPLVRIQTERGHHLVARGPYRLMRHPGYLAMCISVPSTALAVGSWAGLIPSFGFILVILRRARLEDDYLRANLAGYIDYATRVPLGPIAQHRRGRRTHV